MNASLAALATLLSLAAPSAHAAPALTGVVQLVRGDSHLCVLLDSGAVWCRGHNTRGQLGRAPDNDATRVGRLHRVAGLPSIAQIAAGGSLTVARSRSGEVFQWGDVSAWLPRTPTSPVRRVPGVRGAVDVSTGGGHACAVDAGGRALCWGSNSRGQLGRRGIYESTGALPVLDAPPFVQVACANGLTLARTASGEVWWWGSLSHDEPAPGAPPRHRPRRLDGFDDAVDISVRPRLYCIRHRGGGLSCSPGLGAPPLPGTPEPFGFAGFTLTPVPQGRSIRGGDIELAKCVAFHGRSPACRIHVQGSPPELVPVPRVPPARTVVVLGNEGCALTEDGRVACWPLADRDRKPLPNVQPRYLTLPEPASSLPTVASPHMMPLEIWSRLGADLEGRLLQDHRVALTARRAYDLLALDLSVEATLASPLSPQGEPSYPPLWRSAWLREASVAYHIKRSWPSDRPLVAEVGRLRPSTAHPAVLLDDRQWEGGQRVDGLAAQLVTPGWRFDLLTGAVVARDLERVASQGGLVALTATSLAPTLVSPTLTYLYTGSHGDQRLHTLRGAVALPFRSDLGLHLALSLQSGPSGDQVALAAMGEANLRWVPTARLPLTVELGWDHLTGDDAPDRGPSTRFLAPFGQRHGRFGLLDLAWVARSDEAGHGLEDLRLALSYEGSETFLARLEAHRLGLGSLPGGGPLLGHELSGWASLALPGSLALQLGGGTLLSESAPEWRAWLVLAARHPVVF